MTRIDGIIILDTNGHVARYSIACHAETELCRKPIITSHFPTHPPSYPSVHIDAYNHALKSSSSSSPLPSVIWVNTLSRLGSSHDWVGMGGAGLCHLEREGLRFLVPVGHEGELSSCNVSFLNDVIHILSAAHSSDVRSELME